MTVDETKHQFEEMFFNQLKEIYSAEKEIADRFGAIADMATTDELKDLIKEQVKEAKEQQRELEEVFKTLKREPFGVSSDVMSALIGDIEKVKKFKYVPAVQDAAIILGIQKIKHYEMATYGSLKAFAKNLDLKGVKEKLDAIIEEEGRIDHALTSIAEGGLFTSGVNQKATG